ncbi:hypothetical protein TARUN_3645 [Trichoderma arundinaceum]|uniref:DUF427 domain-containing protein n=1 Tax=Trichoderma arundinaceum TaxID=490622 RepID=A0A395NRA8_TRIAR|nr:hypothetical protein TARUN_3645 [Trichoderma arundinaceum]
MAAAPKMNVQSFPRPPRLDKISRHIRITYKDVEIADTSDAYWVLETHHPPSESEKTSITKNGGDVSDAAPFPQLRAHAPKLITISTAYYLPPSSIKVPLKPTARSSWCEWKGAATYYSIALPDGVVSNRIWSYNSPAAGFEPLRGYLSFYAGPWDCFVDGERVEPQPGDFYGGWVTGEIEGIVKGRTGNLDPVV